MTCIPAELRRNVIERAHGCCEYCRISATDRLFPHAIDHIIAEKHGGLTTLDNLCYSCMSCNSYRGSDLTSVDWASGGVVTLLFNPRSDDWDTHFRLESGFIKALTPVGRVTATLLRLNNEDLVEERIALAQKSRYPCPTI